jgi:alkyl hydroperoxide reductase subunit F
MQDLIIIGGGPAATSAGVYASRKKLKTILIAKDFGGQSIVSDSIENWIGDITIPGPELAKKFEAHLMAYAGEDVQVVKGEYVSKVDKIDGGFKVTTDKNTYESKAVLVATGSHRRRLEAENADMFEHKGITYCASCDGPMFTGKDVVVIGGGNAGFESAAQLLAYTNSVTLIHRGNDFKADPVTVESVLKDPKMTAIKNAQTLKIIGDKFVSGLIYKDNTTGEEKEISCQGIFVEVGNIPTTEMVKDIVALDEFSRIKIDPWTQRTETDGVWAAGDCTNIIYHQNNIAAGDAVKALEDIFIWVKSR